MSIRLFYAGNSILIAFFLLLCDFLSLLLQSIFKQIMFMYRGEAMEDLGDRIKLIRGKRTQDAFASSIGIDRTTLSAYERGRREPDLKTLLVIANIGHVSLDWLAGRQNTPSIEQAQAYNDHKWYEVKELAHTHNVKPVKIEQLIKAALALK